MKFERNGVANDLVRVSTNANRQIEPFWQPSNDLRKPSSDKNSYKDLGERLILKSNGNMKFERI